MAPSAAGSPRSRSSSPPPGVWAWEVEPRPPRPFLGHDQHGRAQDTRCGKAGAIDFFYRFLELRYRGEFH
jgi:hypothetical protein